MSWKLPLYLVVLPFALALAVLFGIGKLGNLILDLLLERS